jgi:hypothetical protein
MQGPRTNLIGLRSGDPLMRKAWRQAGEDPGTLRPLHCLLHQRAKIEQKKPLTNVPFMF